MLAFHDAGTDTDIDTDSPNTAIQSYVRHTLYSALCVFRSSKGIALQPKLHRFQSNFAEQQRKCRPTYRGLRTGGGGASRLRFLC